MFDDIDDDEPIFPAIAIPVAVFVLALIGWRAIVSPPVPARAEPAALCTVDAADGDEARVVYTRKGERVEVRIGDELYEAEWNVVPCSWLKNRRAAA